MQDPGALMASKPMSVLLAVNVGFAQWLVIGFSWVMIRLVVGREWPRILGLRGRASSSCFWWSLPFPP